MNINNHLTDSISGIMGVNRLQHQILQSSLEEIELSENDTLKAN